MKQTLMQDLDEMNDKYFESSKNSIGALIDLKVALHEHDRVLDDQIDDFKTRIVSESFANFLHRELLMATSRPCPLKCKR